ncbi:putative leucine-rich repeat-containing, plant-type, leucine-rich repeat domain, L [Rosa chinensis]|uniref:Putative leucine-rich repeat-containing, plant-type, leucine-rich repeat domain, L n=1 Tax=Rosa chinensis TaxID=74649 RepID=A0A2P6RD66_ROSCH|nr:putative leucine-rich repeat-containing, plant-type, leucine-rich repeat domain, L [Rosa chinensis]
MPTLFLHFFLFLITTTVTNLIPIVHSNCIEAEKQSLLHFKRSLVFNSSESVKLITWKSRTECCSWLGVTCSTIGSVVGLDISSESISCSIDNSSSLFQLQHLQSLNLADNNFKSSSIPSAIGKLTELRYLNLGDAYFSGVIPIEISRLTRLITLDLSNNSYPSFAEIQNLSMLIHNLTELTELYLDSVVLSGQGSDWCEAISSSLPNLRVLSLFGCRLSGPICDSLAKLQSLHEIDLSLNQLNGSIPSSVVSLPKLERLTLSHNRFSGQVPEFSNTSSPLFDTLIWKTTIWKDKYQHLSSIFKDFCFSIFLQTTSVASLLMVHGCPEIFHRLIFPTIACCLITMAVNPPSFRFAT